MATEQDEQDLSDALRVMPRLPAQEPRPGFAVRVAMRAGEAHVRPYGAPWWRWAFGGGVAALAGAAALVLAISPHRVDPQQPGAGPGGTELGELASNQPLQGELLIAQRLDLFEDLAVVQNQEALEDLDVVEELHTLQPEAQP